jgi:hypothetical protein
MILYIWADVAGVFVEGRIVNIRATTAQRHNETQPAVAVPAAAPAITNNKWKQFMKSKQFDNKENYQVQKQYKNPTIQNTATNRRRFHECCDFVHVNW